MTLLQLDMTQQAEEAGMTLFDYICTLTEICADDTAVRLETGGMINSMSDLNEFLRNIKR